MGEATRLAENQHCPEVDAPSDKSSTPSDAGAYDVVVTVTHQRVRSGFRLHYWVRCWVCDLRCGPFTTRAEAENCRRHADTTLGRHAEMRRAIDDPGWVLDRYREAKDLIDECICTPMPDDDLREQLSEWSDATTMDECTTFDRDCACNHPTTPEQWAHRARLDVEARLGGRFRPSDAEAVEATMAEIAREVRGS